MTGKPNPTIKAVQDAQTQDALDQIPDNVVNGVNFLANRSVPNALAHAWIGKQNQMPKPVLFELARLTKSLSLTRMLWKNRQTMLCSILDLCPT